MQKKEKFLAELRSEARTRGLTFSVDKRRGKGSHTLVVVGDRFTTIPDRDLDPHTRRKIRKALGLD